MTVVFCSLVFAAIALYQLWHRVDLSNLTRYPDEAAHFVTGVCTLDYFKNSFGSNPVAFAEEYYARYPKVAFGHWPPMFYLLQALWYGLFGPTPFSAMLLIGLITAVAAVVLFLRLKRLNGTWPALLSVAVFLSLPLVRNSALMLMSDMLASLLMLAAVLSFCDWWMTGKRRYWIRSGIWIAFAVLTKESAFALLALAPIAIGISRSRVPLRQRMVKIAASLCLLVSLILILYTMTGVLHLRGIPAPAFLPSLKYYLSDLQLFFRGASIWVFLIALYGAIEVIGLRRFLASEDQVIHARMALLWLAAALISQLVFRNGVVEDRYFLPGFFCLTLLFAQGLRAVEYQVQQRFGSPLLAHLIVAALTIVCLAFTWPTRIAPSRTGYAEIAAAIPLGLDGQTVLISSDALGEGGMIAEWLVRDTARTGVVLRASKVLASSDWMGGNQKLLVKSGDDVRELLDQTPVHFVVLDMYGFIDARARVYDRLLEDTVRGDPAHFRMIGEFPLYLDGHRRDRAVDVYENLVASGRRPDTIRIDMTNTLGRMLQVRLTPRNVQRPIPRERRLTLPKPLENIFPTSHGTVSFGLAPASDTISAEGGWGRVYVTATPERSWSVGGAPDWVKIFKGNAGTGNGVVTYSVAENFIDAPRATLLEIGNDRFSIRQRRSFLVSVPFLDTFETTSKRWILENQPGTQASTVVSAEGPHGENALIIQNAQPSEIPWRTVVYLPGIDLKPHVTYTVSLRLKAEKPALVLLEFGQRRPPYQGCGLHEALAVSPHWQEFALPFQVEGATCGPNTNRLSIEAGEIAGKLWVSQVSIR